MEYVGSPTLSWKPLDYQCPHRCSYCPEEGHSETPMIRRDRIGLILPLTVNAVSVCPDTDLFSSTVPDKIIGELLGYANSDRRLPYIFYTKNPERMMDFLWDFPTGSLLTATVESDIDHHLSAAPPPMKRLKALKELKKRVDKSMRRLQVNIAVQPVMPFTPRFLEELRKIQPDQVCIDRELVGREVPEPTFREVMHLAREASRFTWVLVSGFKVTTRSRFASWPPARPNN